MSQTNPYAGCVLFTRVRLSFPNLVQPRVPKGSAPGATPKYSADFITTPNDPKYIEFVNLCNQVAQAKWGQHYPNIVKAIYADKDRRCFGQGEEKIDGTTYKVLDGYGGGMVWFKGSKNADKGKPQMIGPDNQGIDPLNDSLLWENEARKMYGGCYVNVVLKPWVYDNTFGKGIGADLVAIQFAADGVPFGEGIRDASAMFQGMQTAQPALAAPPMPGMAPGFAPPPMPGAPLPQPGWPQPQVQPGVQMPPMPFPAAQPPAMPGYVPPPMPGYVQQPPVQPGVQVWQPPR